MTSIDPLCQLMLSPQEVYDALDYHLLSDTLELQVRREDVLTERYGYWASVHADLVHPLVVGVITDISTTLNSHQTFYGFLGCLLSNVI